MYKKIEPVSKNERIEILDVIRGFAILGIIIANIQSWSGYKFISFDVLERLNYYDLNSSFHYLFMFYIDTKFYTLFSLLFGIGFYIQFHKFRDEQGPFLKTYRRRLSFLMLFGLIHGFFWSGDILFIYGLMGFILVQLRNFSNRTLLLYAIFFYYIWLAYDLLIALYYPDLMSFPSLAYKTYIDMSPTEVTQVFQSGSFYEVLEINWHNVYWRYLDLIPSGRLTKVLAIFILGYYLMNINYFRQYILSIKLLIVYLFFGLGLTYISYEVGGSMSSYSHDLVNVSFKGLAATGQIFLAMAYIHILAILDEFIVFKKVFHLFSYVGRMSFTNYLMHTLMGILIFYPFSAGLFGTMGLLEISLLALGLYLFQVLFSMIWFKFFSFGPLEWIWRCLTYKQFFSIMRKKL